MREHDFSNSSFLISVDPTSASWFGTAINTLGLAGLSITIKPISGTVNGQFKLQVTDFGIDHLTPPSASDAGWVDYPNSSNPSSSGAISAAIQWQLTDLRSKWLQVVFTNGTSSTPRVSVAITGRGWA
jgi:hypothetical protein